MTDPLYGNRIESFRVELLDHQDRIIGDLEGVTGGSLSWNDNAPIPGGGNLDLTDLGQDIDFSSNRVRPYLRLAVPKREGLVPQPGTAVWTEERRNLALDPLGISSAGSSNNGAIWTITKNQTAPAGNPQGITKALKGTLNAGQTSDVILSSYNLDNLVQSGPARHMGVWLYSTVATKARFSSDPDFVLIPANTWTWIATVNIIPAGQWSGLFVHRQTGMAVPNVDAAYVTGITVFTSEKPAEAVWGGRVSTDPALRYRWLGTANASSSVEERGSLSVPEATIVPDTGPGFVEWPLGVYVMAAPSTEYSATGQQRTIDLVDKITVISDDRITETLQVAQGANIIAAVQQQIQATGETRILATASTATLTNTMTWEPGTSRLRIINDLLSVAGYWSLSTDRSGQFLVQPYIAPADRPVAWSFEAGAASLHSPEWEHEMPLWEATNHVTYVSQENDDGQVWVAYAIDDNPDSPTSTISMKRVLNPIVEENVEAASQLDLQTQANRKLRDNSNVVGQMSVNHAFVPVWYRDSVSFKSQGMDTKATIVEMSMSLEPGALVEARWRQA